LVTVAPLAPYLNPVAAHGYEGTAIALDLGAMAKSLSGANGDATPNSLDTLVVSCIPVGATLSDGAGHSFTATADDTSQDVASWNLSSLTITPPAEFEGCFKLTIAATEHDSEGDISATATATTAIKVIEDSESLIVGGPGPTLDWSDPENWSRGFVPTLSTHTTIDAPSCYTVIITGTQDAHAASLTIPHGAASTEINVGGTLQLAGDLDVSDSGQLDNDGTLQEAANATFIGPIGNDDTIIVDPNVYLTVTGPITGIGKFSIDSGSTLEFAPGSNVAPGTTDSQVVYFEQGAGKLVIDDCAKFAGVITGTGITTHLTSTDLIDLSQLPYVEGSMSASISYNCGTDISTITFGDGISSNNVTLHFSGNYTDSAWSFTSVNGGAGTEIDDPPTDSGTVTSGLPGEITAANAATTDFANAGGINTSLTLDTSQTFGTPGDSFHFKDEISGSKGSGIIDVAGPNNIPASESHHDDAAGTHGPLAISEGGETPGAPGDSFHFKDEISGSKGSRVTDVAELNGIPASMSHHEDAAGAHGPLTISERAQAIGLPSPVQYPDDEFHIVPHHAPSALVTHVPHDLIV
jgi:hypothetical protein